MGKPARIVLTLSPAQVRRLRMIAVGSALSAEDATGRALWSKIADATADTTCTDCRRDTRTEQVHRCPARQRQSQPYREPTDD